MRRFAAFCAGLSVAFIVCVAVCMPVAAREMEDRSRVRLRALEKITARTVTFEADVGRTIRFGTLYIKIQACRKTPPVEQPESAAFLQIWEEAKIAEQTFFSDNASESQSRWVFSGWMFASSPSLSHMDHPIYDVWVLDCPDPDAPVVPQTDESQRPGEGPLNDTDAPKSPDIQVDILTP
jgi:hypothetical protein